MLKKSLLAVASSLMLGLFVINTIPATATTTIATEIVDEGECDKCGKKECKGSCGEAEGKKEEAGEKKSCSSGEGKSSCCSHGQSKKETKAEEKKK